MEKMTNLERARQFMPFAALRGFEDMIRRQTREVTPRRELSEYEAEKLSKKLTRIEKGSMVRITYYAEDAYTTLEGMVSEIDFTLRFLRVIKTRIDFENVLNIHMEESE